MSTKRQTTGRLAVALSLVLLLPVALAAQQPHHTMQDSTRAWPGHSTGMMGMNGMMGVSGMMGMNSVMGMMQGDYMRGMVSTMQMVMRFQPAQVLAYADTLNLTEEQASRIRTIETEQVAVHQEQMQAMIDQMRTLNEALRSNDPDLTEIRALADTAMAPYHAMAGWMVVDAAAVKKLLTPSQRETALHLPVQFSGMTTMMQGYPGGYNPGR